MEIKIRYVVEWNDGKIYLVEPLDIETIEVEKIHPYYANNWEKIIARNLWTGLKDKNGIEIFEGDIFRHEGHNLIVKFEFGAFVGSWCGLNEYVFFNDMPDDEEEVEVLGNVYQNKELIS